MFAVSDLFFAACNGDLEDIERIISEGSEIDTILVGSGLNPLMCAAINGQTRAVQKLVELGADMNASNSFGSTALHLACREARVETVKELFELGADFNRLDNQGETPLDYLKHTARRGGTERRRYDNRAQVALEIAELINFFKIKSPTFVWRNLVKTEMSARAAIEKHEMKDRPIPLSAVEKMMLAEATARDRFSLSEERARKYILWISSNQKREALQNTEQRLRSRFELEEKSFRDDLRNDLIESIHAEQMKPILSQMSIDNPECAICRQIFKSRDTVIKIDSAVGQDGTKCVCKYGYHSDCIESWRIRSDRCPICARNISQLEVNILPAVSLLP